MNKQITELSKIYLSNYTGDIKPAKEATTSVLRAVLKETTFEKLVPLVKAVAEDGMMLSKATLIMASKKSKEPNNQPTNIPPAFSLDEFAHPFAVPMPQYVREVLNKPRTSPTETQID